MVAAVLGAGSFQGRPPDPQRFHSWREYAVALSAYVADTAKADTKKFPKHTKDQKCTNCALYQGKATDAWGGCPLFGTKQVAGPGWCSAWAKKG